MASWAEARKFATSFWSAAGVAFGGSGSAVAASHPLLGHGICLCVVVPGHERGPPVQERQS
jgi:hypothetical protein